MGVKDLQDLKKISMLRSQIESKKIEEIMDADFPTVKSGDKVMDALKIMRETGYQDIPVIEDGEYIGTISYGVILKKKNVGLDSKVENFVKTPPVVTKESSITEVADLMIVNNTRQVPVVSSNKKKVIGVVGRNQLIDVVAGIKAFNEIKVWEIMTTPVESVSDNAIHDGVEYLSRELLLVGTELAGIYLYHVIVQHGLGLIEEPLVFIQQLYFPLVELLMHIHCYAVVFDDCGTHTVYNLTALLECYGRSL